MPVRPGERPRGPGVGAREKIPELPRFDLVVDKSDILLPARDSLLIGGDGFAGNGRYAPPEMKAPVAM